MPSGLLLSLERRLRYGGTDAAHPLTDLPGVGPARARALDKLGLSTVADLLAYFPREYEDRTVREGIAWLPADTPVCFAAVVAEPFRTSYIRKGWS